jgi:glycosyltransferase involved in cell wall biosynthesis
VVARAAAAVPETVGDAAVLLRTDDPLVWAAVVDRVIRDGELRQALVERGRRRLLDFSDAAFTQRIRDLLERLGLRRSPGG